MVNELYTEFASVSCTHGQQVDSKAVAAWLQCALRQDRPETAARCEAYWDAADDDEKCNLGSLLGWTPPLAPDERTPLFDRIAADFKDLAARAGNLLDFASTDHD